jgi:hypothetical protein
MRGLEDWNADVRFATGGALPSFGRCPSRVDFDWCPPRRAPFHNHHKRESGTCGIDAERMITCLTDDTAQNAADILCSQCGARADAGRIFCANCGATLRAPVPLIRPGIEDNSPAMSPMKRMVVTVIKYLAGLSAVVF